MQFKPVKLNQLFDQFGGELFVFGDQSDHAISNPELRGFRPLESAAPGYISFLSQSKYRNELLKAQASVVLVRNKDLNELAQWLNGCSNSDRPVLWGVQDPYLWFARIQQWWVEQSVPSPKAGVHPTAVVNEMADVDPSAFIGPFVTIGAHSKIGAGCQIHANVNIADSVVIGDNTLIHPGVSIYSECQIGRDCIIHSGAVIGADGFGFANHQGEWVKIPQVGRVIVGDQVEIGANTTIDRGALDDTVIGQGVKLDNQIMIGHNCTIGDHTAMAGCVGMAGSTHIGKHCTIGGAAMFFGHLSVADKTHIVGASAVMSSIKEAGAYAGIFPLDEQRNWEKNAVSLKKLNELRRKLAQLEKNINEQPEAGSND